MSDDTTTDRLVTLQTRAAVRAELHIIRTNLRNDPPREFGDHRNERYYEMGIEDALDRVETRLG